MSEWCEACGRLLTRTPVPSDQRTTYCKVLMAREGLLAKCTRPIDGDYQLCEWPGRECPISEKYRKEKRK
jgi:hypothetical protein